MVLTVFEPLWQQYCNLISRGDVWAMLAKLSVEYAARGQGTIDIPYYYGRVDATSCTPPVSSRLPSSQLGLGMFNTFFGQQMGLTLTDAGMCLRDLVYLSSFIITGIHAAADV